MAEPVLAGIELGGTKGIAVLGRGRTILDSLTVPTGEPAATLSTLADRLEQWSAGDEPPQALGIASFGPIAIDPAHPRYGHMLATTKPRWPDADVLGGLTRGWRGPALLHTDVTGAALAEGRWGAAQGASDHLYITVGTGVGVGIIANGRPITGLLHPEAGHIRVRRIPGDAFPGICIYHGDCLEGLASGPAIAARAGRPGDDLAADDLAWTAVADALAEGIADLMMTLAPAKVVLGGGVLTGQPHLLPAIRAAVAAKVGGYLPFADAASVERIVTLAGLGTEAGPLGALALADLALRSD